MYNPLRGGERLAGPAGLLPEEGKRMSDAKRNTPRPARAFDRCEPRAGRNHAVIIEGMANYV
jgi:hypothetical protein